MAFCYFEPVHGTGPDILGQNVANPIASIMASRMLLDHLGQTQAGDAIEAAVRSVIASGKTTPDLGGTMSTQEVGEAIRDALKS